MLATATAAQVELGGPGGATNPEEFFAAAHANCFTSTITSMARSRGIELAHVVTEARVRLEWSDDAGIIAWLPVTSRCVCRPRRPSAI